MTSKEDKARAVEMATEIFPAGATVTTIVRHVSKSGMSRAVQVLAVSESGGIEDVSWLVARALGWRLDPRHGGVRVTGTGMDMCFHLTYSLSQTLHRDGCALTNRTL